MPLLGCDYTNPMGAARPRPPDPRRQPGSSPAPAQGDHVFGNISGIIRDGLMAITGGGQAWGGDVGHAGRFGSPVFDQNGDRNSEKTYRWELALSQWRAIRDLNLGHTNPAPIVTRNPNIQEPDNHSVMFGGWAAIFQWDLCEIVCTNGNDFTIGSRSPAQGMDWVGNVLHSYNKMMEVLVDQTTLASYIAGVHQRVTNVNSLAPHTAISKTETVRMINSLRGNPVHKNTIRRICENFDNARFIMKRILEAMHDINIFWNAPQQRWESF